MILLLILAFYIILEISSIIIGNYSPSSLSQIEIILNKDILVIYAIY